MRDSALQKAAPAGVAIGIEVGVAVAVAISVAVAVGVWCVARGMLQLASLLIMPNAL